MWNKIKNFDSFKKSILVVFAGTSFVNLLNLVYQLLIAHKLSAADFASFNSLLAVFVIITAPLTTIQMAVAKYSAEFKSKGQISKVRFLISDFSKKFIFGGLITFCIFYLFSADVMSFLKIPSHTSVYLFAGLAALAWFAPVLSGGVQGLEMFGWLTASSVINGSLKLALALIFINLGYNISGALGAFFIAASVGIFVFYFPLRGYIKFSCPKEDIDYKQIFIFLFPVGLSLFCFMSLISFDMVLVKYFFSKHDAGFYSLAQMIGKIFFFLPYAISLVMFPKISGMRAKNMDTLLTLKKSLKYVLILSIAACAFYNLFPALILKLLTGKVYPESVSLGRLFSLSMSVFSLVYILISYFLSIKNFNFIKYLALFTVLQFLAIALFHNSLIQVQAIVCINSILLLGINAYLALSKSRAQDPDLKIR